MAKPRPAIGSGSGLDPFFQRSVGHVFDTARSLTRVFDGDPRRTQPEHDAAVGVLFQLFGFAGASFFCFDASTVCPAGFPFGLSFRATRFTFGIGPLSARYALSLPGLPRREAFVSHEIRAKRLLRRELIVRVAAQANVPDGRVAAPRYFQHVIVLEMAAGLASVSR